MQSILLRLGLAALAAAVLASAAAAAPTDRHAYGNEPVILDVTNNTGVTGAPSFPVHLDYADAGCKIVGGTWTDQFGLAHDFGLSPDATCHAGLGTMTPGWGNCTSPTGQPGAAGAYPQSIVLRDAKGRESVPFAFSIVCVNP